MFAAVRTAVLNRSSTIAALRRLTELHLGGILYRRRRLPDNV